MQIQPYLFFEGRCDEAAEFYQHALGAEVTMLMRFKDNPQPAASGTCGPSSANADKVMHMSMRIGDTTILASDGNCQKPNFQGFALSLNAPDDAAAERLFKALEDGGKVQMPLTSTFFASRFGMVVDRFGVTWMVLAGL